MKFKVVSAYAMAEGRNFIRLIPSAWDDYSYKTKFWASYVDKHGNERELGIVKIGKTNMTGSGRIVEYMDEEFDSLPEGFFSLWQTAEAYKRVMECQKTCHYNILRSLKDLAYDSEIYDRNKNEEVVQKSLFREVSHSLYMKQFRRIVLCHLIMKLS